MSAEDIDKGPPGPETRVIDTQAQDAQAPDTYADKTTYVNVAYQERLEPTKVSGFLLVKVSHEASASPPGRKR